MPNSDKERRGALAVHHDWRSGGDASRTGSATFHMHPPHRPFLTTCWTELLLLNFRVPCEVIASLAPPGTEADLFEDQTYISVVGLQFRDTRVLGCAVPGHVHFPEINLRYYVRRRAAGKIRRGVVFVQEIVPSRLIALVANRLFHEHYVCRPMAVAPPAASPLPGRTNLVRYCWRSESRWNKLEGRLATSYRRPSANSFDQFIVEHYWGYTLGRDGVTREYRVAHEPWQVAAAEEVVWDCDVARSYNTPLGRYLESPPASALIADGGPVEVFPGRRIKV